MIPRLLMLLVVVAASSATCSDYLADKSRAAELIAKREYQCAVELAKKLNREMPDDLDVYAYLVDAHLALGQRKEAESAAQWMLDLRTEDPRSLYSAALVREALGMKDGALQFYVEAYRRVPRTDTARRTSILERIERLKRSEK